jgi:hypothetical protein
MAPDLRRKVDENRRARMALEEGMRQQQNAQVSFPLQSVSHHTLRLSLRWIRSLQNRSGQTHPKNDLQNSVVSLLGAILILLHDATWSHYSSTSSGCLHDIR